ncbi:MAG TPA: TPM domain-containing protein [Candidatus Binataceae bacterium]|nr:TPM domain-containing protein [Candidatus Binataceae bacterium]
MRLRCAWADSGVRTGWALLILLLILASPALASEPKFPPLTGRVVDDAAVLSADTRGELTDMLAEHERATGEQVVVVTLESLQGYPIEDYGYQLGRHWGIGQKGTNTGALLIVVPKERKVRIEVGYGLEGMLTDAASRVIIERDIVPNFRRGDFNAGVLAGTTSMLRVLGGNPAEMGGPATSFGEGHSAPAVSAKVKPPDFGISAVGGLLFILPWILLVALFMFISAGSPYRRGRRYGGDSDGWSSGGSFSGGGSSGGGGGFSGGGGSFGGGGASGSW